jgi:hypothetical protein
MKDLKIYIFIASILLIFYLMAQYNRPQAIDWTETLRSSDKIPFGTYVLYNRLNDIFPNAKISPFREPVYNVINNHQVKNGTYIIISNTVNLNEYDYNKLTQYIKNGNNVFIAASYFGDFLKRKLKVATANEPQSVDAIRIGFVNKNLNTYKYAIDRNSTNGYFSSFDTSKAVVIGEDEYHHSDYIKFDIGKGSLYLNACPLMFSNYSLLQDQGSAYTPIALSYLKNDKNLIWDEYYTTDREGDESPMRVFLKNNALRGAYYIALFGLLLFVVYELKRRQRIIPVIEPLTNTTLDFVNVVGQVYYEQRNNSNIAQKKVSYFLEHLRTSYHLNTSVLDDDFINTLSRKSGAAIALIQELVKQIALVRSGQQIGDSELIDLNKNIEQFYLQSR